ncbi:MAG: hypothetical protein ABUS79_12765, partial [Pseudomonadota bacterium]
MLSLRPRSRAALRITSLIALWTSAAVGQTPASPAAPPPGKALSADEPEPPARIDLPTFERAYRAERDAPKRAALVQRLSGITGSADLLARILESDPSDDVALAAAYALRRAALGSVTQLLDRRMNTGQRDPAARERLVREIERHQ